MQVRTCSASICNGDQTRNFIHKTYGTRDKYETELKSLRALSGVRGFPVLYDHDSASNSISMSMCGSLQLDRSTMLTCPPDWRSQLRSIHHELRARGIQHIDVHLGGGANVMVDDDGRLCLIDFENAQFVQKGKGAHGIDGGGPSPSNLISPLAVAFTEARIESAADCFGMFDKNRGWDRHIYADGSVCLQQLKHGWVCHTEDRQIIPGEYVPTSRLVHVEEWKGEE